MFEETDFFLLSAGLAKWIRAANATALLAFRRRCVALVVDKLRQVRPATTVSLTFDLQMLMGTVDALPSAARRGLLDEITKAEELAFKHLMEHPQTRVLHDESLTDDELEWWAVRAAGALLSDDVVRGAARAASAAVLACGDEALIVAIAKKIDGHP